MSSMEEGFEGSKKQAVAAKKLARSGSKNVVAQGRPTPVHGRGHSRRWSSSTDLNIETAQAVTPTPMAGGAATTATVLGRSYSTSATVVVAIDGGAKQEQKQQPAAREGEQRPRRRCGAGARLSRKIKEHWARFYIIRRCVAMLVCWRNADD